MTATIAPEFGGAVMRAALAGRDLLRPARSAEAAAADPREAACFPCVPWFGRLFDGLTIGGRRYDIAPTLPVGDPRFPLHGVGWVRPWRIEARDRNALRCSLDYEPAPQGFPFPFRAAQEFTATEDAFEIVLSLTNTGAAAMPAGLGLHPYFAKDTETLLRFAARRVWTPGAQGGGELVAPVPAALDFSQEGSAALSAIDHSYGGWSGAALRGKDGAVAITSDAPFLHVYAPDGQDFLCLEPVTHLPGTFGGNMLSPAQTISIRLRLAAAPVRVAHD